MKKDLRGSGSKIRVGRKPNTYKTKQIQRVVPLEIYDLCLSLVDAEVLKYKRKITD